ncbi:hypothetical protein SMDB11_2317A [Serratia marcescens subsp. marcescens Db11]|uniref:Uncharacterized protein n=1 Tax=Serratia marcescens subsp. marcescens Db11 TaxID=273526 RepID=A0ABC9IJB1_SERMA|nr:hypothetical protein SMDB11_2317A [Serratia marcescens subsp. marcescens Db11]
MRGPVRLATGGVEGKWPATGRSEAFNQHVTRHFAAVLQQVLKRSFAAFQLLQKLLRRQIVFFAAHVSQRQFFCLIAGEVVHGVLDTVNVSAHDCSERAHNEQWLWRMESIAET